MHDWTQSCKPGMPDWTQSGKTRPSRTRLDPVVHDWTQCFKHWNARLDPVLPD